MDNILDLYAGKKILITGASGFIGSHLSGRLRASDAEIHAVSRSKVHPVGGNLRWWNGDLSEAAWVRRLLQEVRPDVIFHLAGEVNGSRNRELVAPNFRNGLIATVNLLTAVSEIGCQRFVQAGSLEEPETTASEVVPCSPYAAAKWASSVYARMFHALYELPIVVARMFMAYGPAQRDSQKLIPYVILSLLKSEVPRLSSGTRKVDFIYVEDVAEGLLQIGVAPNIEGMTIDLGSGQLVSIRDVVESVVKLVNSRIRPLFGALPDRPMEQTRTADMHKSEAVLHWKPEVSLWDGLQRTIEWYSRHSPDLVVTVPRWTAADSTPRPRCGTGT